MATIKCIKVAVNEEPKVVEIDNGLKSLQKEVNGYIEIWMPNNTKIPYELIVNEEGKFTEKPNRNLFDRNGKFIDTIFGDFLIVSPCHGNYGEWTSLTEEDVKEYLNNFDKTFKKV